MEQTAQPQWGQYSKASAVATPAEEEAQGVLLLEAPPVRRAEKSLRQGSIDPLRAHTALMKLRLSAEHE